MGDLLYSRDNIVTTIAGTDSLDVSGGGTGVATLTDGGILLGSGTGAVTSLGVATNGQIPIGDGTTDPQLATITGTANEIDITNAEGSITVGLVNPLAVAKGGTGSATASDAFIALKQDATDSLTGVAELATGSESLVGTDSTRTVTPSAMDYVLDRRNVGLVNLLSNTGFNAWSNSEDLYTTAGTAVGDATVEDATDLIDNGNMGTWDGSDPDLPTGWVNFDADAGEISDGGGFMHLDVDGAVEGCRTNNYTTETGKLYELTASLTRVSGTLMVNITTGATVTLTETALTATDTTYSVVYEETVGGAAARVTFRSVGGAAEWYIDKVQVHEVTPGIVSTTGNAFDCWDKDTTLDLFRQHDDATFTKEGSFYSLKATSGAVNDYLRWSFGNHTIRHESLTGRTLTFGAWAYASDASHTRLSIRQDSGYTYSNYHTGGSSFEWLEVTADIATTATFVIPYIHFDVSSVDAYISQPMLVFGEKIGSGNYVPSPLDLPEPDNSPLGFNRHGNVYYWDKDEGMKADNRPLQNLLTNSGFGVWSNSEDLYTTAGTVPAINDTYTIVNDDCADDGTGDWTDVSDGLTFDTDHYHIAINGGSQYIRMSNINYTAGKLYEISVDMKDGTGAPTDISFRINDGSSQSSPYINTTGSFVSYTWVFEVVTTTASGTFDIVCLTPLGPGVYFEVKNIMVHEVTPGIVGANLLGPDGWYKNGDVYPDVWREHSGAKTQAGSFYSLKMTAGASADSSLIWPLNATSYTLDHRQRFAGRTVTFGAWTWSASAVKLAVTENDPVYQDQNAIATVTGSAGSAWEWIEVTATFSASPSVANVFLWLPTGATAYISQPMLVFGNSIGEGNYSQPPGEVVWMEKEMHLTNYQNASKSNADDEIINLESETDGKLPKGIKAINVRMFGESTSVNTSYALSATSSSTSYGACFHTQVSGVLAMTSGWSGCDSNGDVYNNVGGASFTGVYIIPQAVQVS